MPDFQKPLQRSHDLDSLKPSTGFYIYQMGDPPQVTGGAPTVTTWQEGSQTFESGLLPSAPAHDSYVPCPVDSC